MGFARVAHCALRKFSSPSSAAGTARLSHVLLPTVLLGAAPAAHASSFEVIHAFSDNADDAPWGGVSLGANGTLYATNSSGGQIVFGPDGAIYGTTFGDGPQGGGTAYRFVR